jgi:DNA-directed RNA polymerase specialized sigma24 family protein
MSEREQEPVAETGARRFETTHWSVVLRANDSQALGSAAALETLCRTYWPPLYAFVLRRGHPPGEAQDLTQEFFARLLADGFLPGADPDRGRFRSYLLGAFKNFAAVEWKLAHRLKRGGGHRFLSLEELSPAESEIAEPRAGPAEEIYDRRWAETVLARVMTRLDREWADSGQTARFDALKVFLVEDEGETYAFLGARLGLSENGVASAVHRLRRRYAELFREEIAHTLDDPAEIAEEIRYLCTLLAKG